jgi:hypothetical protein
LGGEELFELYRQAGLTRTVSGTKIDRAQTAGKTNRAGDRERTARPDRTDKGAGTYRQGKTDRMGGAGRNGDRKA